MIGHRATRLVIDGVEIVFQVTLDTEAPAEMNFFFPGLGALHGRELHACHSYNYTSGVQVRDAKAWSFHLDEAIELFGDRAEVLFASHHWPRWGRDRAVDFLEKQRDLYKFIHDQTLRLANHGLGPLEIAEQLTLPPTLAVGTRALTWTSATTPRRSIMRYLAGSTASG